jgi:hypothetical protein
VRGASGPRRRSLNTIDRHVTYDRDGARVRSAGPIRCTRGERIAITVRIRQATSGVRARGRWAGRCTARPSAGRSGRAPAGRRGFSAHRRVEVAEREQLRTTEKWLGRIG